MLRGMMVVSRGDESRSLSAHHRKDQQDDRYPSWLGNRSTEDPTAAQSQHVME